MRDYSIIQEKFDSAVKGIKEDWGREPNTLQWYQYIKNLPDKERITYLLAILFDQVYNGGFEQYFTNMYGQFVYETYDALVAIGAHPSAAVLSEVLKVVNPSNYDRDMFVFNFVNDNFSIDESMNEKLEHLDDQLLDTDAEINDLLLQYLNKN